MGISERLNKFWGNYCPTSGRIECFGFLVRGFVLVMIAAYLILVHFPDLRNDLLGRDDSNKIIWQSIQEAAEKESLAADLPEEQPSLTVTETALFAVIEGLFFVVDGVFGALHYVVSAIAPEPKSLWDKIRNGLVLYAFIVMGLYITGCKLDRLAQEYVGDMRRGE